MYVPTSILATMKPVKMMFIQIYVECSKRKSIIFSILPMSFTLTLIILYEVVPPNDTHCIIHYIS